MIKLTNRQMNIIEMLLEQTKPIPVISLSKQLNVSERTIRYDLKDIEYWMKLKNLILMTKPRLGIWVDLNGKDRNDLKEELSIREPYEYVLTMREREDIIILLMLLSDTPISSQYIADELLISRNTVINDLKNIKLNLKKYDLDLQSKPKYGFYILGTEFHIRKLINNLLIVYIHERELFDLNYTEQNNMEVGIALKLTYNACKDIKISDIKKAVRECKNICDFWIADNSYIALITDLMITVRRIKSGNYIEFSKARIITMKELQEYKVAKIIAEYLAPIYGIDFNEDEIVYISYSLFNNDFKFKDFSNNLNKEEDYALKLAVSEMIKVAEKHIYLNSETEEKLMEDLLSHMSLTLKKFRIKAENKNPLLDEIKQSYSEEFVIAKDMIESFSSMMSIDFNEDEIGYVAIILAAQLESEKKATSKKALIVCSTGKGSAKILFQRIKNTIPELEILGISSVFELEYNPEILKIADLVISTVYFKTEDKPFIKVSPFVSGSDISKIKSFIYEGKGNILNREAQQEENVLRTFMEIMGKYVAKDKIEKVKQDLNNNIDSIFKNFTPVSNENELYERYSEKTAMSVIEMGEMLNEMYENNIIDSKDKNLFAIVIHIIMAIPRWRIGDYAEEIDIEKYKNQNPEMFKIIKRRLNYISEKYNFNVPETEAVSLMRYLI